MRKIKESLYKNSSQKWVLTIFLTLILILLYVPAQGIFNHLTFDEKLVNAYVDLSFLSIITVVYLLIFKGDIYKEIKTSNLTGITILVWVIGGFIVSLLLQFVISFFLNLYFEINHSQNTERVLESIETIPLFVYATVILVPIMEEVIFRRVIFKKVFKRYGLILAIIISSLVFSLFHFDNEYFVMYFSMGALWSYIYYKTQNIFITISIHSLTNGLAVIASFL